LGLNDEQISAFLAGPPFLPFGWMGCLDGWGGPLPQTWIDSHEQLGKQILAREREFGMKPIQQGFTGHVPAALKEKFPDAALHTIHWIEWTTYLLDPQDPLFRKVAKIFMEEQIKRFGTDNYYAADTFIEMNPPSGDPEYLQNLSRAIYRGMSESDPEAVWVLQTWIFLNKQEFWTQERIKAFLGAVSDDKMLCLDLFCEERPQWSRTQSFYGKPWLWCNIQNFGCTVHMGGALENTNAGLMEVRQAPEKGKLEGLGFVNEGLGYNPVAYDLMYEMAWRNEPHDMNEWIKGYATYRYGQSNAEAEKAWEILQNTVYTAPHRTRSIIDHAPTLNPAGASPYNNNHVAQAWQHLLGASEHLGAVDAYRFDLVNVARQVLSNYATALQRKVVEAHEVRDIAQFEKASDEFLQLMLDLDELLATREEFLLGKTLEDAKRWGTTDEEKAILEWNARRVITTWGTTRLNDYARKEWSGLISGFYHERWKWYLDEVGAALEDDESYDNAKFQSQLSVWMYDWSDARETYPSVPRGNSIEVAQKLWDKYGEAIGVAKN
jgi:alpha-N-acetylglucosaminidase